MSLLISFATKVNVFGKGGILFLAVLITLVNTSWHTEAVILPFRSSFQAELLACPRVLFSSKSLSLSLITSFCKNSLIFSSFVLFLCIISFAMSIMFALFFAGIPSPSIDLNKTVPGQTSSKEFIKEETCS